MTGARDGASAAEAIQQAAATIEAQAALIGRPVRLAGREAATVAGHLEHAIARARQGIEVLREAVR